MKKVLVFCALLSLWLSLDGSSVWAQDVGWMQKGVRVWYFGSAGAGTSSNAVEAYLFASIDGTTATLTHHSGIDYWSSPKPQETETGSILGQGPIWIHPQVLQTIAVGDNWMGIRIASMNRATYTYDTFKSNDEFDSLPYLLLSIKALFDLQNQREVVKLVYGIPYYPYNDPVWGTAYFDAETGLCLFNLRLTASNTVWFILSEINYDFANRTAFAEDNGPHTGFRSNIVKTNYSTSQFVNITSSVESRYGDTVQMWTTTQAGGSLGRSYIPPNENYCFFGSVPVLRRKNMTATPNYPPEGWNEYGEYLWWWVPQEALQRSSISVFDVPMTRTSTAPYIFSAVEERASFYFPNIVFDNDGYMTDFTAKYTAIGLDLGFGSSDAGLTIDLDSSASSSVPIHLVQGLEYYKNTMGRAMPVTLPPAATLVSPTGTITTSTPTYTWNAVAESTWYNLSVNDSTGNRILQWYTAAEVGCGSGTGTCSKTPSVALANGAAQWKVQTYNSAGDGPWSTPMSFTVNAPVPPAAATLVSPSGTITDSTPDYIWNAVSTATDYYLWVSDASGAKIQQWYTATQAGCASGTGTCSVTPATTLGGGSYTWWIQTKNASGTGPWSSGMSFTVSLPAPPAATLVSPTGTITTTTPTYTWNAVAESTWYNLSVNDSTGNRILQWYTAAEVGCGSGTGTCSKTPSVALANGAAQWKVQTYNSAGNGPWSTPMSFTVNAPAPPPAATLVSPSGTITDSTPDYIWNAVSTATDYYLWVSDSTGAKIQQWYTATQAGCASGTGTCSVTPATTLAGGSYTWWIQTKNASGTGPWSSSKSFTVSLPPLPAVTQMLSPTGTVNTKTPTYTWGAVPESTWYYLSVDDLTGNKILQWYTAAQANCGSGTGNCSVTPSTALAAGAAKWKVRTWNNAGNGPWSAEMPFTVDVPEPPPGATLVSPSGTITDSTPDYIWNAVSAATDYYLWVSDASGAKIQQWYTATQAGCASGTGTCSVTPATTLAGASYTWWIQTKNASGTGPWSSSKSFTVSLPPLPAATLVSPSGTITDTTPIYTWNAVSNSTWYYLWVDDSTGNKIQQWYTAAQANCGSGTGNCSVTPSTALATGAAKWWIQTWNNAGNGPWSSGMSFTVSP